MTPRRSGTLADTEQLAAVLVEFAHTLVTDYRGGDVLQRLCHRVAEVLPVTGAGVMLEGEDGHLRFVAASDEVVRTIEDLQIAFGEGPCLYAFHTGEQVVVADLANSDRFSHFAPQALEAGLRAVFSFPMRSGNAVVGALNLYRSEPGDWGQDDGDVAQILADVATAYLLNARAFEHSSRLAGQLQHALDSRVVIEQAKGKLAERLGIDVAEAFEVMRRHARGHGRKLQEVAREVVDDQLRLQEQV
ncbi:MAG: GAF and ANTAR domain-containing protein [Actinomycetota bacterium]|nr:GAF and ANTAR domain-containing protein [Actinomycetota bacterium]